MTGESTVHGSQPQLGTKVSQKQLEGTIGKHRNSFGNLQ